MLASILAKGGACYLAARLSGLDHATSMGIGALMNARGLIELIIINIGRQRGIIELVLFAMLVLMTIVITLTASPLFELICERKAWENRYLPNKCNLLLRDFWALSAKLQNGDKKTPRPRYNPHQSQNWPYR